ncbi:MAG: hypothetical protein IAX21_01725 [Candidatus Bathyarchaeota archaeon]|nr:hypothetical protein [Candidatus Bathyarchaeum tardum]WGM90298.1 MAG: hypothetical protein NUK63_04045 [Candidatus Bathyarchaeum tardum]WNZ29615.1 MAG: hypothetical protein IAX21_01725 [Candidatus Bathyarchaeota archaeon]
MTIESTPKQFNLDPTYAYVGKGNQNSTVIDSNGILLSPISQYPSTVYFNISRPTVKNIVCDAFLEVFNVKIESDKGSAENFIFFTGTNVIPSFSDAELNILTEGVYDLIDRTLRDGVSGNFRHNWTADESILSAKVGSYGTFTNYKNGLGLWSAGKPNNISVTFYRIGFVTITNGAISIRRDAICINHKSQIQLQEYDSGFLKNELVPIDKLSQNNRFQLIVR